MSERNYYVICDDNCKFPAMTKEEIITAITEATGTTPTDIDGAFITKIKELNEYGTLKWWVGTQAEYNALVEKDPYTLYIITDGNDLEELEADLKSLADSLADLQGNITELQENVTALQKIADDEVLLRYSKLAFDSSDTLKANIIAARKHGICTFRAEIIRPAGQTYNASESGKGWILKTNMPANELLLLWGIKIKGSKAYPLLASVQQLQEAGLTLYILNDGSVYIYLTISENWEKLTKERWYPFTVTFSAAEINDASEALTALES